MESKPRTTTTKKGINALFSYLNINAKDTNIKKTKRNKTMRASIADKL